ncbi:cell wall metabolism sensor histidine kinase WalK [Acaryochloris sp. CCMEE 5410]|uniref:sensor histidine kinase n=1 Tax=Acaryochloris sp. CCMEE 5410 TaxID=310037 RepID=UPI0004947933|nr:GAF domain-containing sensor histidine kinase [Acaryochloris sp. CCMEE 5410]KAI9134392.1 GAF domain-containing sensor histidine kinase [Acaryochloris sp. CCMEE 5410]
MMEHSREIEQLSTRNAELELLLLQRTFELEILSELSHQVSYLLGDKDLLSLLINSLDRVLPIDVAAGLISVPGDLQLVFNSTHPLSDQAQADIRERLLAGFSLMNGVSSAETNVSLQRSKPHADCPPLYRLASMVMVPMLVETTGQPDRPETVGMLLIGATAPNAFTQSHLRFLFTVANQGAVSLGRLRSHLSAEKHRLAQFTTYFSEGVVIVSREGHILFTNEVAQQLLPQLADIDYQQRLQNFAQKPLEEWLLGDEPRLWQDIPRLDLTQPPLEVMVQQSTPLSTTDCYTLIIREVRATANLEQLKDQLIATISHELRTPLTLIYAPLEMLASGCIGNLTDEGLQLLDIAIQSANQLKLLIENILELSQLESGLITMQFEPCNAKVLVEKAIALMANTAEQAEIRIEQQASQSEVRSNLAIEPFTCWVDPDYILQAFKHLLDNAIKFSAPESRVTLEVVDQASCILFRVIDEGMGISAEQLSYIFARFQQGDSSRCRTYDGMGIGLAICDRIIHLHGGEIWAESVLQQGSTFSFTLPKARQSL